MLSAAAAAAASLATALPSVLAAAPPPTAAADVAILILYVPYCVSRYYSSPPLPLSLNIGLPVYMPVHWATCLHLALICCRIQHLVLPLSLLLQQQLIENAGLDPSRRLLHPPSCMMRVGNMSTWVHQNRELPFARDFRRRIWPDEGSTVQWKWSPPAPGTLKALLFPPLLNNVQNKGTQGVQARYGAELPPFISIVRCPGRPVILGMETFHRNARVSQGISAAGVSFARFIAEKLPFDTDFWSQGNRTSWVANLLHVTCQRGHACRFSLWNKVWSSVWNCRLQNCGCKSVKSASAKLLGNWAWL